MDGMLSARLLKMTTKRGFIELFWAEAAQRGKRSYEEVYEGLEREYSAAFGRRRYASYESFRKVRDRRMTS